VTVDVAGEEVVNRAAIGARLLTARGAGMRLVSVASNMALIVLVAPADLGLLAVVRGIAGLAGDTSDLGFAWALLRRHTAPTDDEYRALGGVQLTLVAGFLALALLVPTLFGGAGSITPTARHWMLAVLVTMLAVPFGTGARIRIEREMDYQRIAFADVSSVLLLNLTLLGFAIAKEFTVGVFIATGGTILYNNLLLWVWSPGPVPGFRFAEWRRLGREFAGFTLGHVGSLLNASATPLLIAGFFGLPVAGIWSFAVRLGNVQQLAFEGFRRAAIPAAGLLAQSRSALQRLAQQSLIGAARLTLPLIAACYAALPVVGWLLPKWAPAVPLAQLYVLGFGIAGVIGASVVPVSVALHGSRAVLAEQFAPILIGWPLLAALAVGHHTNIAFVVLPMSVAVILATWFTADRAVRPTWSATLRLPVIGLAAACAIVTSGQLVAAHPLFVAVAAALVFLGVNATPYAAAWTAQLRDSRVVES
jgi:O-antigen/teichoic acid export membrane protein